MIEMEESEREKINNYKAWCLCQKINKQCLGWSLCVFWEKGRGKV